LLASTPQIAEVAVFLRGGRTCDFPDGSGSPVRLGLECYQSAGIFETEIREPFLLPRGRKKMTPDQLMGMTALFAVAIYLYYLTITPKL